MNSPFCFISCEFHTSNQVVHLLLFFNLQVPASVRVRRESATVTKPKPKTSIATSLSFTPRAMASTAPVKVESSATSKPPSIDDSYSAFLEDMKALGALDG